MKRKSTWRVNSRNKSTQKDETLNNFSGSKQTAPRNCRGKRVLGRGFLIGPIWASLMRHTLSSWPSQHERCRKPDCLVISIRVLGLFNKATATYWRSASYDFTMGPFIIDVRSFFFEIFDPPLPYVRTCPSVGNPPPFCGRPHSE